jgi:hypothetical protein
LTEHVEQDRYGDFYLTAAIRPSPDLEVIPKAGYRVGVFRDRDSGQRVPMLVAAVSREQLFEVFQDLVQELGEVVDVILETSHEATGGTHEDRYRDGIDLPVLQSYFCDYEEVLLNDGCAGVAVMNEEGTREVQFDEHKLLIVYSDDLKPFIQVLKSHGIPRDDRLKIITEAEHLHSTHPDLRDQFEQFCCRLGVTEAMEPVSW